MTRICFHLICVYQHRQILACRPLRQSVRRLSCPLHAPFVISCSYSLQARQFFAASSCDFVCGKLTCRVEGPPADLQVLGRWGRARGNISAGQLRCCPGRAPSPPCPRALSLVGRNWQSSLSSEFQVERGGLSQPEVVNCLLSKKTARCLATDEKSAADEVGCEQCEKIIWAAAQPEARPGVLQPRAEAGRLQVQSRSDVST